MAISTIDGQKVWQRRDRNSQLLIWALWLVGTAIFMWCWQQISEATTWAFFWDAPRIAADIGGRAVPPRWSYMEKLWEPLWDTLNIATLGTVLALMMAVPVAFMAARNTTPMALSLDQRREAMRELAASGLLNLRRALAEVAQTLGVARSTVYTYLPEDIA